jgi:hypothetical protein
MLRLAQAQLHSPSFVAGVAARVPRAEEEALCGAQHYVSPPLGARLHVHPHWGCNALWTSVGKSVTLAL